MKDIHLIKREIEKEINILIKYKYKNKLLSIFEIVYNSKTNITYKKNEVLFSLDDCNNDTIIKLCKYLNIKYNQ